MSSVTISKAERTKAFIIEQCAPVFNKKGYAGTSLSDIIAVTGLTKGALYGNFSDKNEIAVEVYKYNVSRMRKRFAECVSHKNNAYDKLIAWTTYYRQQWGTIAQRGGCPIQNASVESDDNLAFLKPHVQKSIKNWVISISAIIEEGKKSKVFKSSVNPSDSAYSLITILEGGVMLAKIMNNEKFLRDALDRMVKIIDEELKK